MDAYVKALEQEAAEITEEEASVPSVSSCSKGQRAVALLRLMGLFDRPANADCLAALLEAPAISGLTDVLFGMTEAQRNIAFTRLESARLLTVNRDATGELPCIIIVDHAFSGQIRPEPLQSLRSCRLARAESFLRSSS
jgi:hypothetical protein